jgi:hypothetical protein
LRNFGAIVSSSASRLKRCDTRESITNGPGSFSAQRYSALMKNLIFALALLTPLLRGSPGYAQTPAPAGDSNVVEKPPQSSSLSVEDSAPAPSYRIAAARGRYIRSEEASSPTSEPGQPPQSPTRRRGPMPPPRGRYPGPAYPGMWRSDHPGRRVLIGVLVGFGIGAAVVAKGHGTAGAAVAVGAIGGGIGAGMGAGMR